jgi:transposase
VFGLTQSHRYYLYQGVADMRKGFNGLSGIVMDQMGSNPLDGSVYIFINRRRNRMKILLWESTGFLLYYKRLERGTFELPASTETGINWETLMLILSGISLKRIVKRKRYRRA